MEEQGYSTVRAHFVKSGRVMLAERRSKTGTWKTIGGKPDAGESAEETLRREVREELGVEVLDFWRMADRTRIRDGRPGRVAVFAVTGWSGTPENLAPHEHARLQWFTEDELDSILLADEARAEAALLLAPEKEAS